MAWIPALMKLFPMLGGLMGGGAGAAGSAAGAGKMMSGMGAMGGGGGIAGGMGRFATPGTPGSVNGTPVPPSTSPNAPYQTGVPMSTNPMSPMQGQVSAQQSGTEKQMGALQKHDNLQKNMNGVAEGLKMFGHSLGGLDKTPLNAIPRNQPPVLRPNDIQNPGMVGLAALMQMIAGGK